MTKISPENVAKGCCLAANPCTASPGPPQLHLTISFRYTEPSRPAQSPSNQLVPHVRLARHHLLVAPRAQTENRELQPREFPARSSEAKHGAPNMWAPAGFRNQDGSPIPRLDFARSARVEGRYSRRTAPQFEFPSRLRSAGQPGWYRWYPWFWTAVALHDWSERRRFI